jgi:hypothetical protein
MNNHPGETLGFVPARDMRQGRRTRNRCLRPVAVLRRRCGVGSRCSPPVAPGRRSPSSAGPEESNPRRGPQYDCLADVATNQRGLSTAVESTSSRASDEILSENGAIDGVCRSPSSVPPAEPCPGGWRRAWRAPRSAGRAARARSALRDLTCRRLFERSERSERSELGDRAACPSTTGKPKAARVRAPTPARVRLGALSPSQEGVRRKTATGRDQTLAMRPRQWSRKN